MVETSLPKNTLKASADGILAALALMPNLETVIFPRMAAIPLSPKLLTIARNGFIKSIYLDCDKDLQLDIQSEVAKSPDRASLESVLNLNESIYFMRASIETAAPGSTDASAPVVPRSDYVPTTGALQETKDYIWSRIIGHVFPLTYTSKWSGGVHDDASPVLSVSSYFKRIGTPQLYRNLIITSTTQKRLLPRLAETPTLLAHVRSLHFPYNDLGGGGPSFDNVISTLLDVNNLVNLVEVRSDMKRIPYSVFEALARTSGEALIRFVGMGDHVDRGLEAVPMCLDFVAKFKCLQELH